MHVNREKFEICPVWGELQIKFPVRTKETEGIMVLLAKYRFVTSTEVTKLVIHRWNVDPRGE